MASSGGTVSENDVSIAVIVPISGRESPSTLLTSLPTNAGGVRIEVIFAVAPDVDAVETQRWAARRPDARVAAASSSMTSDLRLAGLDAATAEWVMFPRPDDRYGPGALQIAGNFLVQAGPGLSVVAMNVVREHDGGGLRDTHPGRQRFVAGTRTVDLAAEPSVVQAHIASAVLRRTALMSQRERLIPAVSTSDDALLIASVLAASDRPELGLLADALYVERVQTQPDPDFIRFRADAANYLRRVGTFRTMLESGPVAGWLGWSAVHELAGILRHERATPRKATALDSQQKDQLVADAVSVMAAVGTEVVTRYSASFVSDELRAVLIGWAGARGPQQPRWVRTDRRTGRTLIRYYFEGDVPSEDCRDRRGAPLDVFTAKTRIVDFFAQTRVRERLLWVYGDPTSIRLEGLSFSRPPEPAPSRWIVASATSLRSGLRAARRSWLSRASLIRALSRLPMATRSFREAWVFMDRANLAGDNAEHLYRWVRRYRPKVNAFYVLREDSPDWSRLSAEGFRLVPYGSVRHQLLLHRASEYLSSHAGVDVFRPRGDRLVAHDPSWRFTFLQHGVIHNDLSIWLNNQRLDFFVTSTHDEYSAIAGDDTPYAFTSKEVALTGMPRHDELRRLSSQTPWETRTRILIAPTWRNSLFLPATRPGEPRRPHPDFAQSEYVTSLAAFLSDERLKEAAEQMGGEIVFLPHPNIGPHFPSHLIPPHVRSTSYASEDVQQLLTTSRVFVTDYSSVAFDAAYADTPVVYFQYDAGSIFGSDHTLHEGYFDFDRDGFGIVATDLDYAVDAVLEAVSTRSATDLYRERARNTYAFWDDGACARIFTALAER